MELKDLVGTHVLTAVDMNIDSLPQDIRRDVYENANVINFELDGVTYAVVEDPEDSYRSSMREILVVQYTIGNRFTPCKVKCKMRGGYSGEDILDMRDVITGEIVLSVGTERVGRYYPCFIAEFTPENMIINRRSVLPAE